MNKQITVSLPENISDDEISFFEKYLHYQLKGQKVKRYKNVFVTYSGLCMNYNGLIKDCHHDYPDQHQDYLAELAHYYFDTIKNPENLISLDEGKYVLIHHPWYNYYHWLCECIFRAWMVRRNNNKLILLLPDYYKHSDFIMSPLAPFNFKDIYFIPAGKSLMIKNLCVPQIKPIVDSYDYTMVKQVKKFLLNYSKNHENKDLDLGERIYISRKRALRKKIHNEEEIVPLLLKFGFTITNNEDYTFWEQVAIFSKAKYVVSIHGSGLTNMLFMKEKALVLELRKRVTGERDWYSPVFWYLAEALGFKYYQQLCEPVNPTDSYFDADYIVDANLLERNLCKMIGRNA